MTLSEALDAVYGDIKGKYRPRKHDWTNPIEGIGSVGSVFQTPYEAYQDLKPEYQQIVRNILGREPEPYEDLIGDEAYMDYDYSITKYGNKSQKEALAQAKKMEGVDQ